MRFARRVNLTGRARACVAAGLALTAWSGGLAGGPEWPQFRGSRGGGVGDPGTFPTHFGPATNLAWKLAVPPGQSSPCIAGAWLFLTAWDEPELRTLAVDRNSGEIRWHGRVIGGPAERGSGLGGPAAPTPCTDGARLYAYFGPFGVVCYDFEGRELWRTPLPPPVTRHGVSSSPVLAGEHLLLLRDQDAGAHLLALNRHDGSVAWRVERPEFRRGFCTPLVLSLGGEPVIIAPGTLQVVAYRASDGRELWRRGGLPNEICASPVAGEGLVLAGGWTAGAGVPRLPAFEALLAEGDRNQDGQLAHDETPEGPARHQFNYIDSDRDERLSRAEYDFIAGVFRQSTNALLAFRPGDGPAEAPPPVVWTQTRGLPYVPTPLIYRGRVYLLKNGGLLTCLRAVDGTVLFQEERLGVLGDNYASPVAADGRIVIASHSGTLAVIAAADTLEVLARNPLGEPVLATPAIAGDTLYVRSQNHLWAFAAAATAAAGGRQP